MCRFIFLCCSLALIFIGCTKTKTHVPWKDGTYKGSFQRMHAPGNGVAAVTLEFNYPNWTGSSSQAKYPAIGKGRYAYENDALSVQNESVWTADFDWTLIFNGQYIDRVEGDSLILTKSYGDGRIDVYKLKKQ